MSGISRGWFVGFAASTLLFALAPLAASAQTKSENDSVEVEVVKERYPNRAIKIERHVTLDEKRNYVNHGQWTMFAPDGTMLARGVYWKGNRQGKWIRWMSDQPAVAALNAGFLEGELEESETAATIIGIEFEGFSKPFRSQANFVDGKLVGEWMIVDSDERPICVCEFDKDQLHGAAIWYYPSGQKRRQIVFEAGTVIGELEEWNADGTLAQSETYIDGRRKVAHSKRYDTGEKHSTGHYLYSAGSVKVAHDWWDDILAIEISHHDQDKQKHGVWTHWFANGGKKTEGEFDNGKPVGLHLWWYENGQLETQGQFVDGQQTGEWTWWHENGVKKSHGQIVKGRKVGMWSAWGEDGALVDEKNHGGASRVVRAVPQGRQPQPATAAPSRAVERRGVDSRANRFPLRRTIPSSRR